MGRSIFSINLQRDEVREIGLKEEGWVGSLLGLRIGFIVASFQEGGIKLRESEALNIFVRKSIALGPRCFKCKFDILSGPVDVVFLSDFMMFEVARGVNWGGREGLVVYSGVGVK